VIDKDNFRVVGWNIGKIIPDWVKSFEDWNIYISVCNQVNNAGAKSFVDYDIFGNDSNLKAKNYIDGLHEDVEAGEKDIYDNVEKMKKTKTTVERLFTTHTSRSSPSIF
jgi:hypothetical protein